MATFFRSVQASICFSLDSTKITGIQHAKLFTSLTGMFRKQNATDSVNFVFCQLIDNLKGNKIYGSFTNYWNIYIRVVWNTSYS